MPPGQTMGTNAPGSTNSPGSTDAPDVPIIFPSTLLNVPFGVRTGTLAPYAPVFFRIDHEFGQIFGIDHEFGQIFGVSEGVAAAVRIILSLGGGGDGSVFPGLPMGPNEQQVAQLQPLSQASLAVVATLHSTSVEMKWNEITGPAEAENAVIPISTKQTGDANSGPGATGRAALPNQSPLQSFLPMSSPDTDPDGEADPIWAEISGAAVVTQEGQDPLARFLSGLDEAFSRARLKARQGSLFAPLADAEATGSKLRAQDALLARWSPVVTTMGGPEPAMALEVNWAGVTVARAVDPALQALGSDRERPGAATVDDQISCGGPIPVGRSALTLGMALIGLSAVAWPVADLIQPSAPQRQHRFPRTGRGLWSGRPPTAGPPSGATSSPATPCSVPSSTTRASCSGSR